MTEWGLRLKNGQESLLKSQVGADNCNKAKISYILVSDIV